MKWFYAGYRTGVELFCVCLCVPYCVVLSWLKKKEFWGPKSHTFIVTFIVFSCVFLCVCGGGLGQGIIPSSPAGIKRLFWQCRCLLLLLLWSWVDVTLSSFPSVLDRSSWDLALVACSKQSGWSSTSAPLFPYLVAPFCLFWTQRSSVLKSANHSGTAGFPTCGAFYSELSLSMCWDVFKKWN